MGQSNAKIARDQLATIAEQTELINQLRIENSVKTTLFNQARSDLHRQMTRQNSRDEIIKRLRIENEVKDVICDQIRAQLQKLEDERQDARQDTLAKKRREALIRHRAKFEAENPECDDIYANASPPDDGYDEID
jgi:hypothetical protein